MTYSVERQLKYAKDNLQNIIWQLRTCSGNLKEAKGISVEACTQRIDKIISEYEGVLRQLENVQLKKEEDAEAVGSKGLDGIR